ncbi:MAG: sulfur oxidation c-type cytochrome SoxA, partial [Desulfuromonadales bacterium]|nr:sulfur oxidation c-type cytochrome SoxA [Desulfuromonadales bacterium]NIS41117.1 sulfur oxidation c-type cytochrome SoxA [Desulfuromonadales bacterium]
GISIAPPAAGQSKSGYFYAIPETQAMQDDDFSNPAMLIADYGGELWSTPDGEANKSCEDCHDDASESMKGVKTRYPAYYEPWGKMINLELRINECRENNQKAKAWKYESREMRGMASFIGYQSRGMPMAVDIGGKAKPFFLKGKEFFYERRGQLDMACSHCHEDNSGSMIRANLLSEAQVNGFPTYRLKWQGVGTLHRRFKGCNDQVRATPYKRGSDEYVNLELYMSWRSRGLEVETPSVRN